MVVFIKLKNVIIDVNKIKMIEANDYSLYVDGERLDCSIKGVSEMVLCEIFKAMKKKTDFVDITKKINEIEKNAEEMLAKKENAKHGLSI